MGQDDFRAIISTKLDEIMKQASMNTEGGAEGCEPTECASGCCGCGPKTHEEDTSDENTE